MTGYDKSAALSDAFKEGVIWATEGNERSDNYYTQYSYEAEEWDRGYMAVVEHVYILRALQERGML